MLSKKMTFSLMSLITLLALAFVAVPVMAAEDFTADFSWDSTAREQAIEVTLTFGDNVGLANAQAGKVLVRILAADGKEATVTITGDASCWYYSSSCLLMVLLEQQVLLIWQ